MPPRRRASSASSSSSSSSASSASSSSGAAAAAAPPCALLAVFGSGGHTAEMLALLAALPAARYAPRAYVAAASDSTSEPRAKACGAVPAEARFLRLPRAREVGQSYLTAVLTTLLAFAAALRLVLSQQPRLVLVNGPGTCLPVCAAAVLLRALGLLPRATRVLFVESACRVETLSATGRACYALGLADAVLVQWPQLRERYPRAEFVGLLS